MSHFQSTIKRLNTLIGRPYKNVSRPLEGYVNTSLNVILMKLTKYLKDKNLVQISPTDKDANDPNRGIHQQISIVHVTGTKGKGSTAFYIDRILSGIGMKTGLFTSPDLCCVRERIRIDGNKIDEKLFVKYSDILWEIIDESGFHLTYFEFLTALAFFTFFMDKVDVAIFEVGMGGLFDCTNIINTPLVSVITNIDYDHVTILGNTIQSITWNKVGIVKPGRPVVTTETQHKDALPIIKNFAEANGSDYYLIPMVPTALVAETTLPHQRANMAIAIKASDMVSKMFNMSPLDHLDILRDLDRCEIPGRTQTYYGARNIIWLLDGAHTPDSLMAGCKWAESVIKKHCSKTIVLLYWCSPERDIETTLRHLLPISKYFDIVYFVSTKIPSLDSTKGWRDTVPSLSPSNSNKHLEYLKRDWYRWTHQEANIADMEEMMHDLDFMVDTIIYTTGSLHLVGNILGYLRLPVF